GDEESILKEIDAVVRSKDPDVLMTDGGDAFLMPYLAAKASDLGVNLQLGRDPDRFAGVKAKSYFTYGKIVYKPGQYILRGRLLHVRTGSGGALMPLRARFFLPVSEHHGEVQHLRGDARLFLLRARWTPRSRVAISSVHTARRDRRPRAEAAD